MKAPRALPALLLSFSLPALAAQADSPAQIPFSSEQASSGAALYKEHCVICHGTTLANGQFGTPLKGGFFRNNWKGKSLGELLRFTFESMPPENRMGLEQAQYAAVLAYVFQQNGLAPTGEAMVGDYRALETVPLPW